ITIKLVMVLQLMLAVVLQLMLAVVLQLMLAVVLQLLLAVVLPVPVSGRPIIMSTSPIVKDMNWLVAQAAALSFGNTMPEYMIMKALLNMTPILAAVLNN
ncbi:hypothetical protein GGF37_007176, partial [Kickxella alabastrina]